MTPVDDLSVGVPVVERSELSALQRRELRGAGVALRPLDARRDASALHTISHGSTEKESVWTYLGYGPFESARAMRAFLKELESSEDPTFFTVVQLPSGEPAGVVSFLSIDRASRRLELGHIWYGVAHQRGRVNTEVVYLMLREAFDRLRCRRVEWKCDALNQRSRDAALRLGFRYEGTFRQHMIVKGHNRDTAWFSLLDHEWPAVRRALERWLAWPDSRPPSLSRIRDAGAAQRVERRDLVALGAAALALLFWSGTTSANRIAVAHFDGVTAGILRSALAGLVALAVAVMFRWRPPTSARQVGLVMVSGVASFAIWPALLSLGLGWTTAGHAGLVMALLPVLTVLFSRFRERRVPRTPWWIGAGVALGGTALLMLGRGVTLESAENGPGLHGDLVVLGGCGICAVGYVAGGRVSRSIGALRTTLWGLIGAMTVTIPVLMLLAPRTDWPAVPTSAWWAVAYLTIVSSLLGYGLWFFALGRGGVGRIASLQLAQPVTTLAVAAIVLGETLSGLGAVAAVVLLFGTFLAHRHADP